MKETALAVLCGKEEKMITFRYNFLFSHTGVLTLELLDGF